MVYLKVVIYLGSLFILFFFYPTGDFICNSHDVCPGRTVRSENSEQRWVYLHLNPAAAARAGGCGRKARLTQVTRSYPSSLGLLPALFLGSCPRASVSNAR